MGLESPWSVRKQRLFSGRNAGMDGERRGIFVCACHDYNTKGMGRFVRRMYS
jgi:hypothetical protein